MNKKRTASGFTLLEMMVTVAILAILAMFAAPSFHRMLVNNAIRENINTWQASFYYAQQEALRRKQIIEFCASDDGTDCSASGDFGEGWIVWYQDPVDPTRKIILQDTVPPSQDINITLNQNAAGCEGQLCFWRNGRLPPSYRGGRINFTPADATYRDTEKSLVINSGGRLRGE